MEDPLIALGLVDNRQQVQSIVQSVDDDGSEQIEFTEFLKIIKGGSKSAKERSVPKQEREDNNGAIHQFFKDLTSGKMQVKGNENVPFSLFITSHRRKQILNSMMENDNDQKKKDGEKILNNYKKQLAERLAREQAENGGMEINRKSVSSKSKRSKASVSYNGSAQVPGSNS